MSNEKNNYNSKEFNKLLDEYFQTNEFKSNVCLSKLTNFLQEKYSNYVFKPDTYLNLIEIITLENAKKGSDEAENVLMVNDSNVLLMYTIDNKTILAMEKQANKFMKERKLK